LSTPARRILPTALRDPVHIGFAADDTHVEGLGGLIAPYVHPRQRPISGVQTGFAIKKVADPAVCGQGFASQSTGPRGQRL